MHGMSNQEIRQQCNITDTARFIKTRGNASNDRRSRAEEVRLKYAETAASRMTTAALTSQLALTVAVNIILLNLRSLIFVLHESNISSALEFAC